MMSTSKRGRKRNDNLPPNRARDVQRAFRARRAAHLVALESRIADLEDENNRLRAALDLPQARRTPLGSGPTGRGKAHLTDSLLFNPISSGDMSPGHQRSSSESPSPNSSPSALHPPSAFQNMTIDTSGMMWDDGPSHLPPHMNQRSGSRQFNEPNSSAPHDSLIYSLPPRSTSTPFRGSNTSNGPPTPASSDNSLPDFTFPPISQSNIPSILFPQNTSSFSPPTSRGFLRTPISPGQGGTSFTPSSDFSLRSDISRLDHSLSLSTPQSASPQSSLSITGQSSYGHRRSITEPRNINIRTSLPNLPNLSLQPLSAQPSGLDSSPIRLPSPPIPYNNTQSLGHRARTSLQLA